MWQHQTIHHACSLSSSTQKPCIMDVLSLIITFVTYLQSPVWTSGGACMCVAAAQQRAKALHHELLPTGYYGPANEARQYKCLFYFSHICPHMIFTTENMNQFYLLSFSLGKGEFWNVHWPVKCEQWLAGLSLSTKQIKDMWYLG